METSKTAMDENGEGDGEIESGILRRNDKAKMMETDRDGGKPGKTNERQD